jgi:hypothetical protein
MKRAKKFAQPVEDSTVPSSERGSMHGTGTVTAKQPASTSESELASVCTRPASTDQGARST